MTLTVLSVLKAPFRRHIISVVYRDVINTCKKVFVLSIFTQSLIIQNFSLFLYTYNILHTHIYTHFYICLLPVPGYLDLIVTAVSERRPFYSHHISSVRYNNVLISQGDERPPGVALMIRLKDYALLTSFCKELQATTVCLFLQFWCIFYFLIYN